MKNKKQKIDYSDFDVVITTNKKNFITPKQWGIINQAAQLINDFAELEILVTGFKVTGNYQMD